MSVTDPHLDAYADLDAYVTADLPDFDDEQPPPTAVDLPDIERRLRAVDLFDELDYYVSPDLPDGCRVPSCTRRGQIRGFCPMHNDRARKSGDLFRPETAERFWPRFRRVESGCWEWVDYIDRNGYAMFGHGWAHRFAYSFLVAPIPDGYEVDHLCQNPRCVNPAHLEAVTPEENRRRVVERRTHCNRGHEFTPENTYRAPSTPTRRRCRTCTQERLAQRRREGWQT